MVKLLGMKLEKTKEETRIAIESKSIFFFFHKISNKKERIVKNKIILIKEKFTFIDENGNLEIYPIIEFKMLYKKLEIGAKKFDTCLPITEAMTCINPAGTSIDI
jgi:hypothetical protein